MSIKSHFQMSIPVDYNFTENVERFTTAILFDVHLTMIAPYLSSILAKMHFKMHQYALNHSTIRFPNSM